MPQTESQRRWYLENRERLKEKARAYGQLNKEAIAVSSKQRREKNLEESRAKSRKWKALNRERHRASSRDYGRRNKETIAEKRKAERRESKQIVMTAYGPACACCGECAFEFLTLDHIAGDGAEHRRSAGFRQSLQFYKWLIANGFPPGYRVLCFNCNSARGFYGYCPHHPEDATGVPHNRLSARARALSVLRPAHPTRESHEPPAELHRRAASSPSTY